MFSFKPVAKISKLSLIFKVGLSDENKVRKLGFESKKERKVNFRRNLSKVKDVEIIE